MLGNGDVGPYARVGAVTRMPINSDRDLDQDYDVCIVGAGPAGIACALGARDRGLRVLMLEAGAERPIPGVPDVLAADIAHADSHDPPDIVSASALGGASHWWGGRTVALDPIDFAAWPITYSELSPWYEEAAAFLGVVAFHTSAPPSAFEGLQRFDARGAEVFCPQINMGKRWRGALRAAAGPAVRLRARALGLVVEAGAVTGVRILHRGVARTVRADQYVLACGGLGSLKLLLLAQRDNPDLFGGDDGPLGRGYMGHLTGAIADLAFERPQDAGAFDFSTLCDGLVARRQIRARADTVRDDGVGQIAFWLDNAESNEPEHGSAVASAKYLAARTMRALSTFGRAGADADTARLAPHFANVARAPLGAAMGLGHTAAHLAMARFTGRPVRARKLIPASAGAWRMWYHAEQRSDPRNRVTLCDTEVDSVGLPKLHIDFRYRDEEVASVVRAHELLDADLRAAGAGALRWRGARKDCAERVRALARDGYHQLGGAPMHADPRIGVVDAQCRTHGLTNLWVASSCVFPSGGQANPTLTIVALARRIAEHLARAGARAASRADLAASVA